MYKIDNLLTFTLLFNKHIKDSYVLNCDIDYIWEKYVSMIGFEPIELDNESEDWWQKVVLNDFKAMSLKSLWFNRWGKVKFLNKKEERVLNYLCITNCLPVTPENIFNNFSKYIGDIDNINSNLYKHIHPLVNKFINEYKKEFQRELNIETLI